MAFRYIQENPELRMMLSKDGKRDVEEKLASIINQAGHRFGRAYAHAENAAARGDRVHYVPGFAVVFEADEAGNISEDNRAVPLEIYDVEPGDAGVGQLLGLIEAAQDDDFKPNFAVWITGVFAADVPLHLIGVDASGAAAGGLTSGREGVALQAGHLETALQLLRRKFPRESIAGFGPKLSAAIGDRAEQSRLFDALHQVYRHLDRSMDHLFRASAELDAMAKRHNELTQKLRADLMAEATSRRRAAVAAKNAQLDACRVRNTQAERELALLRSEVRQLKADRPTDSQPTALTAPAAADISLLPSSASSSFTDDESCVAMNDTIEHQAAIIRELRLALRHSIGRPSDEPDAPTPSPRTLADLDVWAAENGDRVIVLKRALSAAKKSVYEDVPLVYQALDILATSYRDVKLGIADRMAFKNACLKAGLDFGGSITEGVTDDYYFNWQMRRRLMDQHIGRGTTRDPRFTMRIYFTWDEELSKVIVGWLPGHLPTRAS